MIITVTPNPGLDLTYTLPAAAPDTEVHRASRTTLEASGKGVNISRALVMAGVPSVAVFPAGGATGRQLVELLDDEGVAHRATAQRGDTRVNTTALTPDGVLAKLNGPGAALGEEEQRRLLAAVEKTLATAAASTAGTVWVALCGSLPPGVDASIVARVTDLAHAHGARCAIDASGEALAAALAGHADLAAPNRRELAEVCDRVPAEGPVPSVAEALGILAATSGVELLVSLGSEGAVYADGTRCLHGSGPALEPVNTAGAGDALLAGWLSSEAPAPERLARAVGWGRSACLSATTVDSRPGQRDTAPVTVVDLPSREEAQS